MNNKTEVAFKNNKIHPYKAEIVNFFFLLKKKKRIVNYDTILRCIKKKKKNQTYNTFNDYQYVSYTHTQLCMNHNSTKRLLLKNSLS
jgi:hypothetical protein